MPDIDVRDSVTPFTDHVISYGEVTVGESSDETVTVKNTGNADLTIGTVGSPPAPFSVDSDGCSGQTLAQNQSCTITLSFSPTSVGASSGSLSIPSNDPDADEATVTVSLSGTGVAVKVGSPPTKPMLKFPANGAAGVGMPVEFKWNKCSDPDGDEITYHLYYSTDSSFTGISPVNVTSLAVKGTLFAGASGAGMAIIVSLFSGGLSRRRRLVLVIALVVVSIMMFVACGGGGGGGGNDTPSDQTGFEETGLSAGTRYYWKVVADDGNGNLTESDVWNFTTE